MNQKKPHPAPLRASSLTRVATSLVLLGMAVVPAVLFSGPRAASGEVGSVPAGVASCTTCHGIDASISHPLLVRPRGAIPASLPLEDGRMTCLTCHDQDKARGHDSAPPSGDAFLRNAHSAAGLCVECHTGGPDAASAHAAGLGRAHLLKGSRRAGRQQAGRLDAESTACVGCHDGSTASDAGAHAMSITPGEGPSEHPIGVLVNAKTTREDCTIRSPHAIDPRVRLYDNAIGCGTCHNVYSEQKDLLVMSNQRSALCLTCHVQ